MFYRYGRVSTEKGFIDVKQNIFTGCLSYARKTSDKKVKIIIEKDIDLNKNTFQVN